MELTGMTTKPEIPQEFHHLGGVAAADGIFAWAAGLAKLSAQAQKAKRERQTEQRRVKARARYAARKASGLPARKTRASSLSCEREWDMPTSCSCATCGMPPCSWCENIGWNADEKAEPAAE
jgi:hypothetical protein